MSLLLKFSRIICNTSTSCFALYSACVLYMLVCFDVCPFLYFLPWWRINVFIWAYRLWRSSWAFQLICCQRYGAFFSNIFYGSLRHYFQFGFDHFRLFILVCQLSVKRDVSLRATAVQLNSALLAPCIIRLDNARPCIIRWNNARFTCTAVAVSGPSRLTDRALSVLMHSRLARRWAWSCTK